MKLLFLRRHHIIGRSVLFCCFLLLAATSRSVVHITPVSADSLSGQPVAVRDFDSGQAPAFIIETEHIVTEDTARQGSGKLTTKDGSVIAATIRTNEGKVMRAQPIIESGLARPDSFLISVPERAGLTPGTYQLAVTLRNEKGSRQYSQDFIWGVLSVNLEKSSYKINEKVMVSIGVLDDHGKTLCDARLDIAMSGPQLQRNRASTTDHSVQIADTCKDKSVTNQPDYHATFQPKAAGNYTVTVRATTANGSHQVRLHFQVIDSPAYVLERKTATRIFPSETYQVQSNLLVHKGFVQATLTERVPASFSVTKATLAIHHKDGTQQYSDTYQEVTHGTEKTLVWSVVSAAANDIVQIRYSYKAPMVSPAFYTVGPMTVDKGSTGAALFTEPRAWQIASDSVGDVILLWDPADGAIPAGWTCVSCVGGDPYFQRFPRAAATPSTQAGGAESVSHTYTVTNVSGPSATIQTTNVASAAAATSAHTHTFGGPYTTSSNSIVPPYANLRLIKANNPSTLPLNAIAMFDVATASLPTGWTHYVALDAKYVRGENATCASNCGAATHTHIRPNTATITSGAASASVSIFNVGGTPNWANSTHTHTIAAAAGPADNNNPVFGLVNFAKNTVSNAVLPNGLIAMFDSASMPVGWSSLSGSGQSYENRLLKGASDPTTGTFGGSDTHNHTGSEAIVTSVPDLSTNNTNSVATPVASGTHTHTVTFSISSANSVPNYTTVVLAKYKAINVSGTVYSDEGTTTLGSLSVKVASAGSGARSVTAASNGTYSVLVPDPGSGGIMTMWLDTNGGASGAVVTHSAGATISGLDIYQNRLITRHEDAGPVTNANIGVCDKTTGSVCTDSDMHFDENAGVLTIDNDWRLYIWGGKTFTPGGAVTLSPGAVASAAGGDLKFGSSTSTLNVASNALSIGGDWINTAGGTFTKSSGQTTTFTATGSNFTVDASTKNFDKLVFSGSGGAWAFSPAATAVNVDSDFTVTNGSVTAPAGVLTIGGAYSNAGTFTHNSGTITFTSTSSKTIAPGGSSFNNVIFNGVGGHWTPITNAWVLSGDLTLTNGALDDTVGTPTNVTVAGNITCGASCGTISFTGTNTFMQRVGVGKSFGTTTGASGWTFNNLSFSNSSGSSVTITTSTAGTGGINVQGNLLVSVTGDTAGTVLDAGNRTWTLAGTSGDPFIADQAGGSFVANTSTFAFTGNNTSGDTIIQDASYNNLTFGTGSSVAENYNPEGALTITGILAVESGATLIGTQNITVNKDMNCGGTTCGVVTLTGGTYTQRVSATQTLGTTSGTADWTFNNVNIENTTGSQQIVSLSSGGSGTIIINGTLTDGNVTDTALALFDDQTNNRNLSVGAVTITSKGNLFAPQTASFTVGGSWANSGFFSNNSGTITFNAAVTTAIIASGGKNFNNMVFNNSSGGWTITQNLVATGNLTLSAIHTAAADGFVVGSGISIEVEGTYSIGGNATPNGTNWSSTSTLFLNPAAIGTNYSIGSKAQSAEVYGNLHIANTANIRTWNSSAAGTVTVDVTASHGSLYSQNDANTSGNLKVFGNYQMQGVSNDYWSYKTDFDGTDITSSPRRAVVRIESSASNHGVTVPSGKSLEIKGGGGGVNQCTDIDRLGASVGASCITPGSGGSLSYQVVNNSGSALVAENAKLANATYSGGTWSLLNSLNTNPTFSAGTVTADWYVAIDLADRDATSTAIQTGTTDVSVCETTSPSASGCGNSSSSAATVFAYNGSWGSPAKSKIAGTDALGHIPQPNNTGALRVREFSNTAGTYTYYQYNVAVAAQSVYADYNFKRDFGKYLTSTLNTGSSESQVISSAWYRDNISTENAQPSGINSLNQITGTWYIGMAKAIILLWDGGALPSGWSCVSCNIGDAFYQRFVRGAATYGGTGGGPETGGHHLTYVSATTPAGQAKQSAGVTNVALFGHTHTWDFPAGSNTQSDGDIKPPYQNLMFIRGPATGNWPTGVIAPFERASTDPPANWTDYSATIGSRYLRGEGNISQGGSATHTHQNQSVTSGVATGLGGILAAPAQTPVVAGNTHTHTITAGTSLAAAANDPLRVDVGFMKLTGTSSPAPTRVLGIYDHTTAPAGWRIMSNAAPYQNNLLHAAVTFGTTGGSATHTHTNITLTSGGPSLTQTGSNGAGTTAATDTHTHDVTYSVDSTTAMPNYRDVVIMKTNTEPNAPTSLVQTRVTAGTTISIGGWTNETKVRFSAIVSDVDTPDTVSLCVEAVPIGTGFTGSSNTTCGASVASGATASVQLDATTTPVLADNTEYHWQAFAKDSNGAFSVVAQSYPVSGNAESTRDFGVDTTAPTGGTVYDNQNTDSQPFLTDASENGDGSLTTLSASWGSFNSTSSGLQKYQYAIGTTAGATDVKNWADSGTGGTDVFTRATGLSLQTNKNYYISVRAIDNANNTSSVVSSNGQHVTPTIAFDIDIGGSTDPGSTNPPYSIDFGTLLTGSVVSTPNRAWLSLTSNGANGARIYLHGNATGLFSAAANFTILSSSTDISMQLSGYGAQVQTTTQGSGGPLQSVAPYTGIGNNVGILDTSLRSILSSAGTIVNGRASVNMQAKITNTTPASNDYQDIITFIAASAY